MKKEKELYKGLKPLMSCVDHTVSKEPYELIHLLLLICREDN